MTLAEEAPTAPVYPVTVPKAALVTVCAAACAFGLVVVVLAMRATAIDLEVYRAGGQAVLDQAPLYKGPVSGGLNFVYPPFAALVFVPLAPLTQSVATILVVLVNTAMVLYAAALCWRSVSGALGQRLLLLSIVTASLLLATDAVHVTFSVGQINLVLLVLVLGDLLRADGTRSKGVGLGIAAGLKLTPLIFVVYLLVTRQFRAALVSMSTFLTTVALGFLVLPSDSATFWFSGTFGEVSRIVPDLRTTHNHSLRGLLFRTGAEVATVNLLWITVVVVAAAVTLMVACWAYRRGEELLALTLCGLGATALSPWSWSHHWVWLLPLAVFLASLLLAGGRVAEHPEWLLPAVLLPLTFPPIVALADPPDAALSPPTLTSGPVAFVLANIYVLIFFSTLGASMVHLYRSRAASRQRSSTTWDHEQVTQVPSTTVAELPAVLPEGVVLLDVREDDEWAAGHAPNALHVPMSRIPAELDRLPVDAELLVVCKSGGRSAQVVAYLSQAGREAVNVDGGMMSWSAAGRPMVADGADEPYVV